MENDELMAFTSSRLGLMRKNSGLSQQLLAERSGISVDSVGKLERGEQLVSLNTLNKLCGGLGTTLPVFFEAETESGQRGIEKTILDLCVYMTDKNPRHIRLVDEMARQLITRLEADEDRDEAS